MFARALEGVNVKELISKVGSAGSGAAAPAASGAADAPAVEEKKEEEKKEEEEEEDDDMGFGQFHSIFLFVSFLSLDFFVLSFKLKKKCII